MATQSVQVIAPLPDMSPERDFDRLAEIAASICNAPIAFVSVVDEADMWFKARIGFDIDRVPRTMSFCDAVGMTREQVVVTNLLEDMRTRDNPLVEAQSVRFYAGHPILDEGGRLLGSVCVLDHSPRPHGLTQTEQFGLTALADQAASLVRMRTRANEAGDALRRQSAMHDMDRRRIAKLSALVHLGDRLRNGTSEAEAFGVAGEALGMALDAEQAGYVEIDERAGTGSVVNDWCANGEPSANGEYIVTDHETLLCRLRAGEPVTAMEAMFGRPGRYSHLRAPVMLQDRLVGFVYAIDQPGRRWRDEDMEFARGVGDRVHETVARLRIAADRDLVVTEVGHRLKNVMAVTRAIAMQTLAGRVGKDVSSILDERLSAYSGAHDMLLAGSGEAAGLRETVGVTLDRLTISDRVDLRGHDMDLNERATLTVSLLVNELATNAMKHGALSIPDGSVETSWSDNDGCTTLTWTERGGPAVTPPTRKGFGSRILSIGLDRVGGTTLDYAPEGLTASFSAATSAITPEIGASR